MEHPKHKIANDKVVIDLSMVYEICGESDSDVERILGIFLKNIPKALEKISNSPNGTELYNSAHAAKSSLSVIKIPVIYNKLLELEMHSKTDDKKNEIEFLIEQIEELYGEVQGLLKSNFQIV